jgi:hypothetical protein
LIRGEALGIVVAVAEAALQRLRTVNLGHVVATLDVAPKNE